MRTALVAALLGTLLICVLAGPEGARAEARAPETKTFEATAKDGTVLRGHVTLPEGSGPFATILELSPYFNTQLGGTTADGPTSGAQEEYLNAGFAIAQVNMRGSGLSDGCLQFADKTDWTDAEIVIETLADQPWSNGKVGMIGHSYSAWSQYMAIAADPPALKAVIPTSGVSDPWELLTRRGAPIHYGPLLGPVWSVATGWAANENNQEHVCADLWAKHVVGTSDLIATGDRTDYWKVSDLSPHIKDTDVAVWRSNGLNYWGEGHWQSYDGEWDLLREDRTRMILGQWNHETPDGRGLEWFERTIAWFDHYLRGGPEVPTGEVEFQDTAGKWHKASSWPPDADEETLHLSGMSLVPDRRDVAASQQAFQTAGGVEPGIACGGHQAFYVSPPVKEDVVLAGYFDVRLSVTSTQPGGNLVALLRHLPSEIPCEPDTSDYASMLTDAQETAVGRMQMDLRHWKSPGKSRLFPVLEPTNVTAPSGPFAAAVPAGHRLVLFVAGGSGELEPDQFSPALTITTGGKHIGSIRIPVVKGDLRFEE